MPYIPFAQSVFIKVISGLVIPINSMYLKLEDTMTIKEYRIYILNTIATLTRHADTSLLY